MGGYGGYGKKNDSLQLENIILNKFKNSLNKDLIIKRSVNWEVNNQANIFDFVIFKENDILAIIEVKNILLEIKKNEYLIYCKNSINLTNARFCIFTDNNLFYLYDRSINENKFFEYSFDQILIRINNIKYNINPNADIVIQIFKEKVKKYFKNNEEFIKFIDLNLNKDLIGFDEIKSCFYFNEIEQNDFTSFENKFFYNLLGSFKINYIYRYTTLNGLFDSLKNLTFRMNGIIGMNDKSETNFVDQYLLRKESSVISDRPLNFENSKKISSLNKRYISSCSSNKDDLTLWRLYGDDAKGVCMEFKINTEKINSSFLIHKVKYANSRGEINELDFIAEILQTVNRKTRYNFEFRKLKVWNHFFKPYEYAIEKEIRILVIDNEILEKINEDWILTNVNSIINPVIDFRLNDINSPFQLNKIIIGPKCPERITNQVQINEMILRKIIEINNTNLNSNLNGIKVECSKIMHYR